MFAGGRPAIVSPFGETHDAKNRCVAAENVSAAVSNFGELEAALRVSGCHRAMLLADRPIVFSPGGCSPDALPLALRELGARGRRMNRSEHCAWVGTIEGRRLQGLTRTTAVEATVLARSY